MIREITKYKIKQTQTNKQRKSEVDRKFYNANCYFLSLLFENLWHAGIRAICFGICFQSRNRLIAIKYWYIGKNIRQDTSIRLVSLSHTGSLEVWTYFHISFSVGKTQYEAQSPRYCLQPDFKHSVDITNFIQNITDYFQGTLCMIFQKGF